MLAHRAHPPFGFATGQGGPAAGGVIATARLACSSKVASCDRGIHSRGWILLQAAAALCWCGLRVVRAGAGTEHSHILAGDRTTAAALGPSSRALQ